MRLRTLALALCLVTSPSVAAAQDARTPAAILKDAEATNVQQAALLAELKAAIKPVPVADSAQLAAALALGGDVYLKADTDYPGSFVITQPTRLIAESPGSRLTGSTSGPALRVKASHVKLDGFIANTPHPEAAIVIGTGLETTVEQTPEDVEITRVTVDNYRGKRALAVHGRNVRAHHNTFTNIWASTLQDSQAIWTGNAPCRPCIFEDNILSAGSEIILIGGARMAIPDVHPRDVQIRRNRLFRPESWRTDGVNRAVKNIFEAKDGEDVVIEDNDMSGSWVAAQDGPAIVLTPKSGGNVQRVTVQRNRITRVGYGFQVLAADYHVDALPTPELLSGLVIRGNYVEASRLMGWTSADGIFHPSRGIGALLMGGLRDVTIDGNTLVTDGAVFVEADSRGSYITATGLVPNPPMGRLSILNNRLISGDYGLRINGWQGGTQPTPPGVEVLEFAGNTVALQCSCTTPARILKQTFPAPSNIYVTRAEWDALVVAAQQ